MQNEQYKRRVSRRVKVGSLIIGGDAPVWVQSMTTVSTLNTDAVVAQIIAIADAGGEIIRLSTPSMADAKNLGNIKAELAHRGYADIPIVADVHFNAQIALQAAKYADKVRINPGNWGDTAKFRELITICKERQVAIRIGVNHGSLSAAIMERYGNTPVGMVASAVEFLEIAAAENFDQIVVSFKSSNVRTMVEAYRLGVKTMDAKGYNFPLHLGVTEAGEGDDGRMRSAVGIGALLIDGIGDTIRVSLTESPENEIPAAFSLLQASRARITRTEIISCPGCSRTMFDLIDATKMIKQRFGSRDSLKIAVMGCVVNGVGEMADADFGYVGAGKGRVSLYKNREIVASNIPEAEAIIKLEQMIDEHSNSLGR